MKDRGLIRIKRMIREHYEQLDANKFDKLDEIDQVLERHTNLHKKYIHYEETEFYIYFQNKKYRPRNIQ
jgi:hypothetical protein